MAHFSRNFCISDRVIIIHVGIYWGDPIMQQRDIMVNCIVSDFKIKHWTLNCHDDGLSLNTIGRFLENYNGKPSGRLWNGHWLLVSPFPLYFSRFFSVAFGSHSRFTSQLMNSTSLLYNEGLQFCLVAHVQIGRRSSAISLLTLWDSLESPVVWRFPLWELLGILLFSFVHSRGIWTAASTLMGGCVKAPRIRSKNLIR